MIFGGDLQQGFSLQGAALASIAGSGYGAFSVAMKRMGVSGGLHFTRQLLLFGSLYLLMPAAADGFAIGELSPLLALAALPTILGFFCTTKAIEYLKPSQVQAPELTEPLFAALLAFVALNEVPPQSLYAGAALIIVGLCFSNELMRLGGKACAPSTSQAILVPALSLCLNHQCFNPGGPAGRAAVARFLSSPLRSIHSSAVPGVPGPAP